MKLTNSNGAIFEINPLDLMERVNKEGIDRFFHPKELFIKNAQEGDWAEYFVVPTSNGIYNPESNKVEFCTPFWNGELTDVRIKRVVFRNGQWHYDRHAEREAFPGCTSEY